MKEIRILYIVDEMGAGGKERRLLQLLKGMDEKEDVSYRLILLTDLIHYREVFDLDTDVTVLERKIRKDPSIFLKIYKICKSWNPHIIHAWGSMPAIYAIPVSKILGIRLINASVADAPARLNRSQWIRSVISFPFSDIIQSNSYAGLKAYNVPEKKSNVIHNGFDLERIEDLKGEKEVRDELGIDTEYVIGMVAGFNSHKDYESLIMAADRITGKREDVSFLCIGGGSDLEKIKSMASGNKRIIFTGRRDDVESIVNIFDIGALISYGEGISNSIMEYMALGKPVIATTGGGTNELVVEGRTGYLIPQESPDLVAEKIEYLLEHRELRERMGEKGRERIEREFNIEKMVNAHLDLYKKIQNE